MAHKIIWINGKILHALDSTELILQSLVPTSYFIHPKQH
jgi:hypothetical protein